MPDQPHREVTAGAGGRYGRLPWLHPDHLDATQRELYARIASSPRASTTRAHPLADSQGRLHGPFNAMLMNPGIGSALQELGTAVRFNGTLPGRVREISILEVARARQCEYEWEAHAHAGRRAGLSQQEIDAVRLGLACATFTREERLARKIVAALLRNRDLSDDVIEEIEATIGLASANELLMLVGYYDLLALSLRVWRTPLPDPRRERGT